jgi:SAM-dependent methyltransferase
MRKSVRRVLYRFLPARPLLALILLLTRRRPDLASAWGYARSVRLMRSEDEHGRPLPWVNYCAVELLQERLTSDLRVLEFGAGHSTMFFLTRVAHVTSIEHHDQWLELVRKRTGAAAKVTLLPAARDTAESYTLPIRSSTDTFDLIMVDGLHRVECFQLALERLTPRGVIILDDSDRPAYAGLFTLAAAARFRVLNLRGHKADSVELHRTSFFYRDHNCLGI